MSGDLLFYYHRSEGNLQGMFAIYVDNTIAAGHKDFLKRTEKIAEES